VSACQLHFALPFVELIGALLMQIYRVYREQANSSRRCPVWEERPCTNCPVGIAMTPGRSLVCSEGEYRPQFSGVGQVGPRGRGRCTCASFINAANVCFLSESDLRPEHRNMVYSRFQNTLFVQRLSYMFTSHTMKFGLTLKTTFTYATSHVTSTFSHFS